MVWLQEFLQHFCTACCLSQALRREPARSPVAGLKLIAKRKLTAQQPLLKRNAR